VVECNLAKVDVEGSNPFSRSRKNKESCLDGSFLQFCPNRRDSNKPKTPGPPDASHQDPDWVRPELHGVQPAGRSAVTTTVGRQPEARAAR
jgi:hypothetical protein